jgi:hypothetical protein
MDEDGQDQEHGPQGRQADGLDPIGRALRATYDAENHDSLGSDLTGLMLELARVEPDGAATPAVALPPPAAAPAPPRPSLWARLTGRA